MISKNKFWSIITCLIVAYILILYTVDELDSLSYTLTRYDIDSRLDDVQHRVERQHKMYSDYLLYEYNYETEFDPYWELAMLEDTYVISKIYQRAIEEGDGSYQSALDTNIQKMNAYVNSSADYHGRLYIKKLVEALQYK